jgi:hypothetical protein
VRVSENESKSMSGSGGELKGYEEGYEKGA